MTVCCNFAKNIYEKESKHSGFRYNEIFNIVVGSFFTEGILNSLPE